MHVPPTNIRTHVHNPLPASHYHMPDSCIFCILLSRGVYIATRMCVVDLQWLWHAWPCKPYVHKLTTCMHTKLHCDEKVVDIK